MVAVLLGSNQGEGVCKHPASKLLWQKDMVLFLKIKRSADWVCCRHHQQSSAEGTKEMWWRESHAASANCAISGWSGSAYEKSSFLHPTVRSVDFKKWPLISNTLILLIPVGSWLGFPPAKYWCEQLPSLFIRKYWRVADPTTDCVRTSCYLGALSLMCHLIDGNVLSLQMEQLS